MYKPALILLLGLLLFLGQGCKPQKDNTTYKKDIERLYNYLDKGDSVFKKKSCIENFATGMRYYDSANVIAEKYDMDSLKYDTYLSIARAYDAWNKEPQATVDYYTKASEYAHKLHDKDEAAFWWHMPL